ncbi:MAG: ribosome biogenesis GTPase YlqF [Oscillospiraceae bacterium]|nr:ribosome biogenesis GTPase YlqF [Oscillospiraceae bacterium]
MSNKPSKPETSGDNHNIHWFPGHMAKTRRVIEENLKLIDVLVEITDARIPESGRNPLLSQIAGNKPRILLLNKRDYADDSATRSWLEYYKNVCGITAISCDCRSGAGLSGLNALFKKINNDSGKRYHGATRIMAAGIPNSGKSSFINRMAGGKRAAVGDRPGVTRGKQWVSIKSNKTGEACEILDLPGILPPKIEERLAALNLAYTGAVKDEVVDVYELAASLAAFLAEHHSAKLKTRYNLDISADSGNGNDVLGGIAKSRGMLISGGGLDVERAAFALLDDFRSGKIGKITLEFPPL